jgi:hypothetical protein
MIYCPIGASNELEKMTGILGLSIPYLFPYANTLCP